MEKNNNRFNHNVSGGDDYRREQLIKRIESSVEKMSLGQLEAIAYDLFTKGYMEDY